LARDLAQFGIDGGVLLIGVAEVQGQENIPWRLEPVVLEGLSERIEQIARSSIDPVLPIHVRQFTSATDAAKGYLVVDVPASVGAPHMVDGVYYGRGDKTRRRLSDTEVMRLHGARRDADAVIDRLLDEEIERDPYGAAARRGHLYLVAQPQLAVPELALPIVQGDIRHVLSSAEQRVHPVLRQWAPTPASASSTPRRADGVALCSHFLGDGRQPTGDYLTADDNALDIELREDGGIRVFVGRMTAERDGVLLVMDGLAIAYVTRLVEWARSVSVATGHQGRWLLGVAATRLHGASSAAWMNDLMAAGSSTIYSAKSYRATTTAALPELQEQPGEVVERLIGRLLRGLGTDAVYRAEVQHPTTAR
jgi:hypothetical protein